MEDDNTIVVDVDELDEFVQDILDEDGVLVTDEERDAVIDAVLAYFVKMGLLQGDFTEEDFTVN